MNLQGQQIKETYGGVLNIGSAGLSGSLTPITDGEGNVLPIEVSSTTVNFTGNITGAPLGSSGTSGTSGVNGSSGASGTSGTSGINGTNGTSGINGTSGTSGINGTSGTSGINGTSGTSGAAGSNGSSGSSGVSGANGSTGSSGTSGAAGTSNSLFNYQAKTNSQSGNPGSGHIIWDNATQASATSLNVSELEQGSINIDLFLSNLAIGSVITIQDQASHVNFQTWTITSKTDNSTYWTYGVTLNTSTHSFSNNDPILLIVVSTPSGSSGSSGVNGTSGTSGINGTSGTSGATGPEGLGLTTKNIGLTAGQFAWNAGGSYSYYDWAFTVPFNTTNYSVDVQWNSNSTLGGPLWADFSGVYGNIALRNKTNTGITISLEGVDLTNPSNQDFLFYAQAIALGETSLPGQDGSSGSSGVSGTSGTSGTSGATGAYTVANYGAGRITFSDGSSTGIGASPNLVFNGQVLGVTGQAATYAYSVGSTGGTVTLNWNNSNIQRVTLTSSISSLTKLNPVDGAVYTLQLTQGGSGGYTIAWGSDFRWPGGTAPTLSTAIGAVDFISFVYDPTPAYFGNANLNFS